MQAHCDYVLSEDHPAAEFAMWWNPRLHEAHLDMDDATSARDNATSARDPAVKPRWAGGSWQPPAAAAAHAQAMLSALAAMANGTRVGRGTAAPEGDVGFVPGLPRTSQHRRDRPKPWARISQGRCRQVRGRIMRRAECEAYASRDNRAD